MIDLEAIKSRVLCPEHGGSAMPGVCLVGGADLAALVAEVERLRGECGQAYLQGVKAGRDAERISERAAVVAYLRELGAINSMLSPMKGAADDIERGEHHEENE